MFELFQHNEDKQIGEHSLYTHIDPDFFLLYDFTTLKWMTDCVTYGMSFRQMTSRLDKPWISLSHVCFSHELLASVGLGVLRNYLDEYEDKQVGLYAFVLQEIFNGDYAHYLQFAMGSVHSEMVGRKMEKPKGCQWPDLNTVASIHLRSCKGLDQSEIECALTKICQLDHNQPLYNYRLGGKDLQSLKASTTSSKRPIKRHIIH